MARSSTGWRLRLGDSRSSAPAARRTTGTAAPLELTAVPGRGRRLSDGVLVDASVHARLLGLRLLTLDATIVIAPAEVTSPSPAAHRAPRARASRSPGRSVGSPGRSVAARPGLAQAVQSINEAAELLAATRRDGPARRAGLPS